jgi:diacylglycerol O-acyltransferase
MTVLADEARPWPPRVPERLSGLDASFVYIDDARVHMHTLKLLTLDPATIEGGYSYRGLVRAIHDAAAGLPNWCSKLAFDGIGHPRWVPDADFDIDAHVERIVVATDRELDQVVAARMARPLPHDRPLWRATIIEESKGRHVSVALAIHHSLADGIAFSRVLESITEHTTPPGTPPVRAPPRRAARSPLRILLAHLARLPALLGRTLWGAAIRLVRRLHEHRPLTWLFHGPKLSFNAPLTSARAFARASIPLALVQRIKDAVGTTVNDVVMATAAEALQRWMDSRRLDTSRPLVAGVPVSAEGGPDRGRRSGNMLSHVPVCLHTDIDDPIDRLRAIHHSAERAKADLEIAGHDLLARWSELTMPWILRSLWSIVPRLPRPPINLVLANVPGPRTRLRFAGAEVEDLTSVGPILDGVGLNITAWSYCDRVNYGMLAVPEQVPDLAEFASDIETAATQMEARARCVDRSAPAAAQRRRSGWFRGSADALHSQVVRYFAASTVSFAVDFALLSVLHVALGMHLLTAGALAFGVGVTINYALAIRWVFPHRNLPGRGVEYLGYVAVGLSGLALNELVLWGISERMGAHFGVAKALSGLVVLTWTFSIRRALLFRPATSMGRS